MKNTSRQPTWVLVFLMMMAVAGPITNAAADGYDDANEAAKMADESTADPRMGFYAKTPDYAGYPTNPLGSNSAFTLYPGANYGNMYGGFDPYGFMSPAYANPMGGYGMPPGGGVPPYFGGYGNMGPNPANYGFAGFPGPMNGFGPYANGMGGFGGYSNMYGGFGPYPGPLQPPPLTYSSATGMMYIG